MINNSTIVRYTSKNGLVRILIRIRNPISNLNEVLSSIPPNGVDCVVKEMIFYPYLAKVFSNTFCRIYCLVAKSCPVLCDHELCTADLPVRKGGREEKRR